MEGGGGLVHDAGHSAIVGVPIGGVIGGVAGYIAGRGTWLPVPREIRSSCESRPRCQYRAAVPTKRSMRAVSW